MVTAGRARGVVVGTGASTAIGRIRDAMAEVEEEDTPLKQKLDQFGAFLSKASSRAFCFLGRHAVRCRSGAAGALGDLNGAKVWPGPMPAALNFFACPGRCCACR